MCIHDVKPSNIFFSDPYLVLRGNSHWAKKKNRVVRRLLSIQHAFARLSCRLFLELQTEQPTHKKLCFMQTEALYKGTHCEREVVPHVAELFIQ